MRRNWHTVTDRQIGTVCIFVVQILIKKEAVIHTCQMDDSFLFMFTSVAIWCFYSCQRKSTSVIKGNPYIKSMLCEIAGVIAGKRNTYLPAWYWIIKQKKGAKKRLLPLPENFLSSSIQC